MSEYSKWFWDNCEELNKDTSFAHRLAEKSWNHQQTIINDLKAQLECCRKENTVLLGKVGEGEKRIRRASQLMDRAAEDGTESVDIGSLYDALIKGSDLDESLRGAND